MRTSLHVLLLSSLRPLSAKTVFFRRRVFPLAVLAASFFVAGCGVVGLPGVSPSVAANGGVAGRVHGGQQPVAFATVTLYAPGTTAYGSAPTVIVSSTSDAQGSFTLPRPYTCPANSGNVYLVATGGDSGAGTNPVLALAAELGPCTSLSASSFIDISEVTTVAAAYTLLVRDDVMRGAWGLGRPRRTWWA